MTIEELEMEDENFNSSLFLSKANNIFVKLLSSVMFDKLDEIDHFISDEVYNQYKEKINRLKEENKRQMYDELNVKDSKIHLIAKEYGQYIIVVRLEARYLDYIIDLKTGKTISGNEEERVKVKYSLEFVRNIFVDEQGTVRRCPHCGSPLDVNNSGKCKYCGGIYNQEDYDYILNKIEQL